MQHQVRAGGTFVLGANKVELTPLKVVFGSSTYARGNTVWVRGDAVAHEWAQKVYTVGDDKFILMPEAMVVLCDDA